MSDAENDRAIAKVHQEVATRNATVALEQVGKTKEELNAKIMGLELLVTSMKQKQDLLEQRVNLLLTKNFSGGATEEV